jgi:hypothetical protein
LPAPFSLRRRHLYIPGMTTRAQLQKAVADAEAELEAAKTLTAVKAAAKKLQRAKAELKELEAGGGKAAEAEG